MKQIVVLADDEYEGADESASLGPRGEVLDELARRNTATDGRDADVLHGPGFRLELSPGQDPVTQMLLTITDEDIFWVVIPRLVRAFHWKLLDPMTGRELRPR